MMAVHPGEAPPSDVVALADAVGQIAGLGLIREAEVATATLALLALERLETGRMRGDAASDLFTTIDVRLTDAGKRNDLSDEASELLVEAGWLDHWGGDWGPDRARLEQLALAILRQTRAGDSRG